MVISKHSRKKKRARAHVLIVQPCSGYFHYELPRRLVTLVSKHGAGGPVHDLVRDSNEVPILAADPANKDGAGFLHVRFRRLSSRFAIDLGRLLLEELVDGFHL